jgi:glucan endo-1,3-alpha-glucosidase
MGTGTAILSILATVPLALSALGATTPSDVNAHLEAIAAKTEAATAAERGPDEGRHIVFAHYMTCFFNTVEFYMQEIELAQRHGIDGFALNCGAWTEKDAKTGEIKDGPYVKAAERMYEAARRLDTGFKLMMSPDGKTEFLPDMVRRFYKHPNQFRWNGKAVISGWAGTLRWGDPVRTVRGEGYEFLFVPNTHLVPKYSMAYSHEAADWQLTGHDPLDGYFLFAIDGTVNDLLRDNAVIRRAAYHHNKIFMAGVAPAYNSPNLRDFHGFRGYDVMWQGIVRDRPEWVEIVTWNDYTEDSQLMPWRWQQDWEKQVVSRDESFLDATGYYARWFKSRRQPAITQDKVYYTYRNRSQWLREQWNPETEQWLDITSTAMSKRDQIHDDVQDKLYATTFLTAPAELTVELGGKTHRFQQPAGVAHVNVPMAAGTPRFKLARGGKELASFVGRKQIIDEATMTKENSWKGDHFANRTWTGGAAIGPVAVRLEAAAGELREGAEIVSVGRERGVRNQAKDRSGVRLPLKGLATATYNIRVRYSNPATTEARLTLCADGPPRGTGEYPYYIPLFLPPTGEGVFETVSFLWSLYDKTSFLEALWMENGTARPPRQGVHAPLRCDQGTPVIASIELIKVEPTIQPARRPVLFPELVEIPGGTFTMGSNKTVPDEAPAHRVSLSPFAIGKYEVTNEEFERFDPEHRKHRDGFSWRDREPVIYVSWMDGIKYCNWLSAQAGLTPVYAEVEDEKTKAKQWRINVTAEGFRLPSEAEWEYIASGRDEGRTYPWGNDEPVAGLHGHFPGNNHFWPGPDPLVPNVNLPSDPGGGTMVVGTYPAGASRDGVMDLAGNVSEWVGDWLQPYAAEQQTDPHVWDRPSPYRAIRGSSWGYFGRPLRVTDREFNHPGYPGYIYIGFRVVLPEAGRKKLIK